MQALDTTAWQATWALIALLVAHALTRLWLASRQIRHIAHHHGDGNRHAALARRAVGRADQAIRGLVEELQASEQELLALRAEQAARQRRQTEFVSWSSLVVQLALLGLVLWLLHLVRRSHGLSGSAGGLVLTTAFLVALTGVAWVTTLATPDLFVPVLVLALYLLVFRRDQLTTGERLLLVLVTWLALALLITNPLLAALLLLPLIVAALVLWRSAWARSLYLAGPALVVALGIGVAVPGINSLNDGQYRLVPGTTGLVFSQLVAAGVAQQYLNDHCQDPQAFRLCAVRDRLPDSARAWLTDEHSPFFELGGWDGFKKRAAESRRRGMIRGIGLATYIEACGIAPSNIAGALGARAGLYEAGEVRVHPTLVPEKHVLASVNGVFNGIPIAQTPVTTIV